MDRADRRVTAAPNPPYVNYVNWPAPILLSASYQLCPHLTIIPSPAKLFPVRMPALTSGLL
jgi:hypothetical protein